MTTARILVIKTSWACILECEHEVCFFFNLKYILQYCNDSDSSLTIPLFSGVGNDRFRLVLL
jgi:hypothetical protein